MLIPRYYQNLSDYFKSGKVLVIFGPRQVGKTTLVKEFLKTVQGKYKYDSGEFLNIQQVLSSQDLNELKKYTEGYHIVVIDEAQKIPNIGLNLKLIVDNIPDVQIIATGSSSFDLLGQVGEPLVGRKINLKLYSVSQLELLKKYNRFELESKLEDWLIYGGYPAVVNQDIYGEKVELLEEITQGYLLKDILEFEKVKGSKVLVDLLTLVALQIGSEVSHTELSQKLGINIRTVQRYLDLFEKSFILFNLRGLRRNSRKEIVSKSKYYFFDNGVRNALISNFNPLEKRDDAGALWENFLVVERLKLQEYTGLYANNYFWRTWEGQEIDWVEERGGKYFGYEFKFKKESVSTPTLWVKNYPNSEFRVINKNNYLNFVLPGKG